MVAALYADDGTLWKRGRNIKSITMSLKAITEWCEYYAK